MWSELGDEQETKAEIKNLFRNWMIFIIIIDLFLITMGITSFCKMRGVCPEYQRWTTMLCCIVPAVFNTRHAIRNYKGEI